MISSHSPEHRAPGEWYDYLPHQPGYYPYFAQVPAQPPQSTQPLGAAAAAVFGMIALSMHWLLLLPPPLNLVLSVPIYLFGSMAVALGWLSSHELLVPSGNGADSHRNKMGFWGLTLGIVSLVLSTFWLILGMWILWYLPGG
ncbi:MAG: hypothetical protein AB1665_02490 [Candidatus Thermoplasmatota archaeon]